MQEETLFKLGMNVAGIPRGVFSLSNERDTESLKEFIQSEETLKSEVSIVVYGVSLAAYCAVQGCKLFQFQFTKIRFDFTGNCTS